MKKYILLFGFSVMLLGGYAQQDPHFSQYMFNGLVLNPAYAGSRDVLSTTLIYRNQWAGMDGAPKTGTFSIHAPSADQNHGFGLSFVSDNIGASSDATINLSYAYRIKVGKKARLALGLQGMVMNYKLATSEVRTGGPGDPAYTGQDVNLWMPNAGAGLYLNSDRYYAGFSVPHLISNKLNGDVAGLDSKRYMHSNLTAGAVFRLGNSVKFKPSFLLKMAPASPLSLDLNASFLFKEMLWLGVSYRTQDAVVFILELQATRQLRIGYAYDLNTSALNAYNSGSHELMIGFDFNFGKKSMISPRYF